MRGSGIALSSVTARAPSLVDPALLGHPVSAARGLAGARVPVLPSGFELGQIRGDLDAEIVLDAIYGPLWTRLVVGHLPLRSVHARRITAAIWPGIATI
jgi:hypothetical protein